MFEKKKFLLNCDVCDTRKIKEEDYTNFEQIMVNADVVLVNEHSKSVLNCLPIAMNHDKMIELSDQIEAVVKVVNGSYEITGNEANQEHTILVVNGSLKIDPGTAEVLQRYEQIIVNGSAEYPKSLNGFLSKMSVNGSAFAYPDDCILLKDEFTIDQYFPLRAKENGKYYAKTAVIIKDRNVDIAKLAGKKVRFITNKVILPECKIEESVSLFDEQTEMTVVPEFMDLVYGDSLLNEEMIRKEGDNLFVYGNLETDENADMNVLCEMLKKLVVKGKITLKKEQLEAFEKLDAEYDEIEVVRNSRVIKNMPKTRLDKNLFDNSPEGIKAENIAQLIIDEDVTPEMILEKLTLKNCARVNCTKEQESAVAAIAVNVAGIGEGSCGENMMGMGDIFGTLKDLAHTKMVNADSYIM